MDIKVKIADANIGFENDVLKTMGLGSCVTITLFDRAKKIGGLIHFMLPYRLANRKILNNYKYCDIGTTRLIEKMEMIGAKTYRMEARIVGGANMFSDFIKNMKESIGYRNIEAAKKILIEKNIPLLGQDVGEDYSRSVEFVINTGIVKVTSYKKGEIILWRKFLLLMIQF